MTINQRVLKLIDQLAVSKSEFSKRSKISAVKISHISSGRNKVSLDSLIQILEAYPEVNAEYLLRGKGPVFKEDNALLQNSLHSLDALEQQLKSSHQLQLASLKSLRKQILSQGHA